VWSESAGDRALAVPPGDILVEFAKKDEIRHRQEQIITAPTGFRFLCRGFHKDSLLTELRKGALVSASETAGPHRFRNVGILRGRE